MPEHFRSGVAVVFIGLLVFAFARRSFLPAGDASITRQRNAWLGLTLTAFLTGSFWIFCAAAGIFMAASRWRRENVAAAFLGLVLCLPNLEFDIPGFGLVNLLFVLNYQRLLALTVLLPGALVLWRSTTRPGGLAFPDKMLAAYVIVRALGFGRDGSVTSTLRDVFMLLLDTALPYYVLSRGISSLSLFRQALTCFLVACLVLGAIGIFEATKHWLLFQSLGRAWGFSESISGYLNRGGLLRVQATAGHPIALGYVMTVGLGVFLFTASRIRPFHRNIAFAILLGGLAVPVSRGPWVGAIVLLGVYAATGPRPLRATLMLAGWGAAGLLMIALMPGGRFVLDLMPFLGSVETGNIDYRQKLLEKSWGLIQQYPWLGPPNYQEKLAGLGMVQGQGIVDIVNTYLQVALDAGLLGLAAYALTHVGVIWGVRTSLKALLRSGESKTSDLYRLGRALAGILCATAVVIAGVSSITIIPWVLWSFLGVGMAYRRVVAVTVSQRAANVADHTPSAGGCDTNAPLPAYRAPHLQSM